MMMMMMVTTMMTNNKRDCSDRDTVESKSNLQLELKKVEVIGGIKLSTIITLLTNLFLFLWLVH